VAQRAGRVSRGDPVAQRAGRVSRGDPVAQRAGSGLSAPRGDRRSAGRAGLVA
jgi:hypothetical protein